MLDIKKSVNNYNDYPLDGIEVLFETVLSYGEEVKFTARYNDEGKMVDCSAPYTKCNNADYYIEIAQIFQQMKDLQYSENLLEAIKKAKEVEYLRNGEMDVVKYLAYKNALVQIEI